MEEINIRRDRRAEWIIRNRLHPQYAQFAVMPLEERGPTGLLRRYPHRVGFVGPNGIKRIDRLNQHGNSAFARRSGSGHSQSTMLPLHQVVTPDYYIIVVPDMVGGRLTSHDKDLFGQAHQLINAYQTDPLRGQGAVVAVVFGTCKEEHFDLAGVDRLVHLTSSEFDHYCPEQKTAALVELGAVLSPIHWLLPDSTQGGFELGARLAARLGERPATQVWQATREISVCRGGGGRNDITRATPRMLLLAAECALPIDDTRHEVLPISVDINLNERSQLTDLGSVASDPQSVPLTEAGFILSAGNGIRDWDQFHHAARLLGATEGASRVAVDNGFMPRHRQVGATGSWVTARVYIAVGISGAIQHLQGIGAVDKVIAVNTDAGSDMVKRADLALIVDSYELLAALIELVQQFQSEDLKNAA
jgi:electron transfer flavoprotein alpha subunit